MQKNYDVFRRHGGIRSHVGNFNPVAVLPTKIFAFRRFLALLQLLIDSDFPLDGIVGASQVVDIAEIAVFSLLEFVPGQDLTRGRDRLHTVVIDVRRFEESSLKNTGIEFLKGRFLVAANYPIFRNRTVNIF